MAMKPYVLKPCSASHRGVTQHCDRIIRDLDDKEAVVMTGHVWETDKLDYRTPAEQRF